LIISKSGNITTDDLVDLGNAEDYLRVSSNISSLLEFVLASKHQRDISKVFTFSSNIMPIMAVLLTASVPVHLYVGEGGKTIFDEE